MLDRRTFVASGSLLLTTWPAVAEQQPPVVEVVIDTRAATGKLPHVWEECVGSDRAAITLRESWRRDLDRWSEETGIKRVRFHGIFNDELNGSILPAWGAHEYTPNFQLVDQVYDGLLARKVSPFVELSFMPKALASANHFFGFYHANVSPPASMDAWSGFIRAFAAHLTERYGANVVRTWPFEVWNEPNLPPFWSGTQLQYFELYKATAVALKSIDPALQVGGPATSSSQWLPEFMDYCRQHNAPLDFISTHTYPGDSQKLLFGKKGSYAQADVIPEVVMRARQSIDATIYRDRPLWLTEWSSDSPAMIAHIITHCLPYCHAMSQWALSGTFEELGVDNYILKEGDSGWGMMTLGIAKPSFNTYKLLHRLGTTRLSAEGPALASRSSSGSVSALVWNLADVEQAAGLPGQSHERNVKGEAKRYAIQFTGARPGQHIRVHYVDQERGSPMPTWRAMGSPQYIKPDQLKLLRQRAEIPPPQMLKLNNARQVTLDLPPEGVALLELA